MEGFSHRSSDGAGTYDSQGFSSAAVVRSHSFGSVSRLILAVVTGVAYAQVAGCEQTEDPGHCLRLAPVTSAHHELARSRAATRAHLPRRMPLRVHARPQPLPVHSLTGAEDTPPAAAHGYYYPMWYTA